MELTVGQEVRVFDERAGKRRGQPDEGWPGVITLVHDPFVTIQYRKTRITVFRQDTQKINNGLGNMRFELC